MGPKFQGLPSLVLNVLLLIIRATAFPSNAEHKSYHTISLLGKTQNNCVCFNIPENKEKVTSILSPSSTYKRLVIYLYQDDNTKGVYLFIPNQDKQRLFPNLKIEDGDILTLTNKASLLPDIEINPNSVVLRRDIVAEEEAKNKVEDQTYLPISNGQHYPVSNYDIDSPLWIRPPKHAENIQDYDASENFHSLFEVPFVSDEIQLPIISENGIPNRPLSQTHKLPIPYESNSVEELRDADVPGAPIPIHTELNPLKYLEMIIEQNPEQPESNIIHIKNSYPYNIQNSNFFMKNYKNASFKQWLNQQMENINERSNVNVNQRNIEDSIQQILRENGIVVTSSGALLSQNGELLDPLKLQIRPILIGDTIQYQQLMAELKRSSNLPLDLPYLHALIISYIDRTPKVLGVVPIRKVYLVKNSNVNWLGGKTYGPVSGNPIGWKELSNGFYSKYNTQQTGATQNRQVTQYLPVRNALQVWHRPIYRLSAVSSGQFINSPHEDIDIRTDNSHKEYITDNIQNHLDGTNDLNTYEDISYKSGTEDTQTVNLSENKESEHKYGNIDDNIYIDDAISSQNDDTVIYGDALSREISDGAVNRQNLREGVNPEGVTEPQHDIIGAAHLGGKPEPQRPSYRRSLLSKLIPSPWDIFEKFLPPIFKKKSGIDIPETSEESEEEEEDQPGFRIIGGSAATGSGAPLSSRGRSGYD